MFLKILSSIISLVHGLLFILLIGGMSFGVGLGELDSESVAPFALVLFALGGLTLILAPTIFFLPRLSCVGLILVLSGVGILALWKFFTTGFTTPFNLVVFLLEISLSGIPFILLRKMNKRNRVPGLRP